MSQRERPAPTGNGVPVPWDDLYDRLPHHERAGLMDAAAAGVAADQVSPPTVPPPHLLHRLLTGDGLDDLHPIASSDPTDDLPDDLDPPQRAAVSLSLQTPDIALVQGRPGAGQERVAAAAALLAVRRGERVLLVGGSPAALDEVLGLLADCPEVCPLRCVGRDESADLSPAAAACTFAGHTRRLTALARCDADLADRQADAARARHAVADAAKPLAALRPLAAASATGKWWTPAWWRARFAGDVASRLAELVAKHRQAEIDAAAIAAEVERIAAARANLAAEHDCHRAARRQAEIDGLGPPIEGLPGRLVEAVNLVAATPAALAAERHFGDNRRGLFDLLIVLEAHALTDGDLLAAARWARRWVLIGEPAMPEDSGTNGFTRTYRPGSDGFARLWNLLHCDPWCREGSHVVCRLRPVPADRRERLNREPVADRPDVELRIDTPAGGPPELAEVAFPVEMSIAQAVEYLFAELGELPASGDITVGWAPPTIDGGRQCPPYAFVATGVRATIGDVPGGWDLRAVDFDPARWDHERAAAWVRRHVVRHGPGRTVRLDGPSAAGRPNAACGLAPYSAPFTRRP